MNQEEVVKINYKKIIKQSKKEGTEKLKGNIKLFIPILALKFLLFLPLIILFCFTFYSIFNNEFILKPILSEVFYYLSIARESNKYLLISLFIISFFSFYIINLPLKYGIKRCYLIISNLGKCNISEVFFYYGQYKYFFKILLLDTILKIKKIFYFALCIIPSLFLFIYSSIKMQQSSQINHKFIFGIFIILSFGFATISILFFLILSMKYMFASSIFIENNHIGINKCIKRSCIVVKKNRLNIIRFLLSFSLLFLSCLLILPIFYVLPYINLSLLIYGKNIPIKSKKDLEATKKLSFKLKTNVIPGIS